jgi:hypothetical protein
MHFKSPAPVANQLCAALCSSEQAQTLIQAEVLIPKPSVPTDVAWERQITMNPVV